MLTGRQPFRSGMVGRQLVQLPSHSQGLPHEEVTLPEALKTQGYKSGIVGKWHLGINNCTPTDGAFLPHSHGFDYVGTILPFTLVTRCDTQKAFVPRPNRGACFLYRNRTIVQQPIDLAKLTPNLLQDAKAFLHENSQQPFFLYFSFPQVHTPMYNMPRFKGSSKRGEYGDQIAEMSWAVGEIMDTLTQLGIADNTLTMFVSDHGPHLEMCDWGGHAGPFSGGKGSYHEGGLRVPLIAHWPGVIAPGQVSSEVVSLMDILPTFLQLAGGEENLPQDRTIDGRSFADIILLNEDTGHHPVHDILFIYDSVSERAELIAARYKQYKIYFQSQVKPSQSDFTQRCLSGKIPVQDYYYALYFTPYPIPTPEIFDIESYPGEMYPIEDGQTVDEILAEIEPLIERERDTWTDRRAAILVRDQMSMDLAPCCNPPFCYCDRGNYQKLGVCEKR